jgi:hypothetical protein
MKTPTLTLFCISLTFLAALLSPRPHAVSAGAPLRPTTAPQIEPQATKFTRLFGCDQPDRGGLRREAGLVLERPERPQDYRLPQIVLTDTNGRRAVFRVRRADWLYFPNPLVESDTVKTTFQADNVVLGANPAAITFELQSGGNFQPRSGILNPLGPPSQRITFRTCGPQSTSAYYWTRSSQTRNEAFACPATGKPKGCPGVGRN